MPKIEKKSWVQIEVKALEASDEFPNGSFEAVLSTDDLDRDGEILDYGAFEPLPDYLPVIVDHDAKADNVVGWGVPTYEPDRGLVLRGGFDADEFSQKIRGKLISRSIRKMSIGFGNARRVMKEGVPHVTSGEALEGSFVVIPANTGADVTSAKRYADVEPPEGSFEDVQEDVLEALYAYYGADSYICVIATFPDHVVYAVRHYPEEGGDGTYSVPFAMDVDGVDGATFTADPASVEITQVISEKRAKHMTENYLPAWAAQIDEKGKAASTDIADEILATELSLAELEGDLFDEEMDDDGLETEWHDADAEDDGDELDGEADPFDELESLTRELAGVLESAIGGIVDATS